MTAWLLIAWVGMKLVVPGIATEEECKRVGAQLVAAYSTDSFRCIQYQKAP